MVTPAGLWLNPHGIQRDSSGDTIQVGIAAECADGGINAVRFSINGGAPVDVTAASASLIRFSEQVGATDPLTGCAAGQQAPCVAYGQSLSMAALPAGPITVDAMVIPVNGTVRMLPRQTHWNNKDGALTRVVMHVNYATGNDANAGTASGTAVKTMQAALVKGSALAAGNDLGLVDVMVHGACLWNQGNSPNVSTSVSCSPSKWCRIIAVDGTSSIAKDGDWQNKPWFSGANGDVRFWFQNLKLIGKLRTQVDASNVEVCLDHCTVVPHSPWDTTANPWAGAYDEGRHGLFWVTNGEPATTWALGCDISGMDLLFTDKNTVLRGCKLHRGYGTMIQLAGGGIADAIESNVAVWSCDVEQWRDNVDNVKGRFADVVSTGIEFVDNGSGKLRIREQTAGTVADFHTESANLVGSTTIGVHVDDTTGTGGTGRPNGICYAVLAAGLDGSSRQYADLNVASSGLAEAAGNTVTLRTARISDGLSWTNLIHGDLVKLDFPTVARNLLWNVRGGINSSPRGFGLDSHLESCWLFSDFHSLAHASVRNDDVGAAGCFYVGVVIENYSADGSLNLQSTNNTFHCELRDSIIGNLTPGGSGSLAQLAAQWSIVNCHFLQAGQAIGVGATSGSVWKWADPGLQGDASITNAIAIGTASGQLGRPSPWFVGNRGVLRPGLVGDFSVPGAAVSTYTVDVDPMRFHFGFNSLRERATLRPYDGVLVRPVWPSGTTGGGIIAPAETGTATSATASTLTDSSKTWATDSQQGYFVSVPATSARKNIKSNTGTVLTLCDGETFDTATQAALNAHASYEIGPLGPAIALQTIDSPFNITNPNTGQLQTFPDTFPYPPTSVGASEPSIDEVDFHCDFDATTTIRGKFGKKPAMVTRLRVTMQDSGRAYDVELLKREAAFGLGASFGGASVLDEFRFVDGGNQTSRHNPTHGGSEARPYNDPDATHPGTPYVRLIPSPPIQGGTFVLSGPPGVARTRGTVTPVEFEADGRQFDGQRLGGSNDSFLIYPFQKQTEAYDPCIGGRKFIHRVTHLNYDPAAYDPPAYGNVGEMLYIGPSGGFSTPRLWDEAYCLDPITGVLTPLDPTRWPNGVGNTWQVFTPGSGLGLHLYKAEGGEIDYPNPFTGNYGAIILRRISDDFTVGLICKLRDVSNDTMQRSALATSMTLGQGQLNLVMPLPTYDDVNQVVLTIDNGTYGAPPQGWCGCPHYQFIGPFSQAVTAIRETYTSGLLDQPIDLTIFDDIPDVLIGTDLEPQIQTVDVDPMRFTLRFADIETAGLVLFVVEDGTGLADANSYASITAADNYFAMLGDPAAWTTATTAQKQSALRVATNEIDLRYAQVWTSSPKLPLTQALAHPQGTTYDVLNRPHTSPPLPDALVQTCCEAALREVMAPGSLRPAQPAITSSGGQTIHMGPFSFQSSTGATVSAQDVWGKLDQMMRTAGLIETGNWAKR